MKEAKALIEKYKAGNCTPEELQLIDKWLLEIHMGERSDLSAEDFDQISKEVWQGVLASRRQEPVKAVKLWPRIAVAAAAVAAVVVGIYFFTANRHLDTSSSRTAGRDLLNDIAPGKNGATITLANGEVIQLDSAKNGLTIGSQVSYSDGSAVRYSSGSQASGPASPGQKPTGPVGVRSLSLSDLQGGNGGVQMLTASTSKGQTYQFTLPDGTKVWLNADSKISFPSQFNGSERKILLSGEGYFEVAKNKARPFLVESNRQTLTVLGTHFNINAYADEIVTTTTLLEGSVRITSFNTATGRETVQLKPNQQSILNSGGTQVLDVDVNTAMGWKNGLFAYKNTPLNVVMRQIARWYNVDVQYEGDDENLKGRMLSGSVSKYDKVSGILKAIELTGAVKFKIKDKTITVYRQ